MYPKRDGWRERLLRRETQSGTNDGRKWKLYGGRDGTDDGKRELRAERDRQDSTRHEERQLNRLERVLGRERYGSEESSSHAGIASTGAFTAHRKPTRLL